MSNKIHPAFGGTKLKGPIVIFGAGGFVGINLLNTIFKQRSDVFGLSSNPQKSWRIIKNKHLSKNILTCNILNFAETKKIILKYRPQTIFNLAAYGAYPFQKKHDLIYKTNFNSTINIVEILKKIDFKAYIHAGSQSEYGLNCSGPKEEDSLIPNSHYAVSKTAVYYLLKYYGKIEKLPVVHLRLYSVYGPWEEPSRLMPSLIKKAINGDFPDFADPAISRDFVYVDDVVEAMIKVASRLSHSGLTRINLSGEVFNVATGKKTTIKELAFLAKKIFKIKSKPEFDKMPKRDWDVYNWYGNPKKIQKMVGWKAVTNLKEGLLKFYEYEKTNS